MRSPMSFSNRCKADLRALYRQRGDTVVMVERVEMSGSTTVADGKVYSVKRQSEPFFLLRLNGLSTKYLVVTADAIDFHGFERFVWPLDAAQICVFEKLDDASAYYSQLTNTPRP
jgi:hypothetical protein